MNAAQKQAVDYILPAVNRGSPYVRWYAGQHLEDGPPAWSENAPAPDIEYVVSQGGFCAAVPNLMRRAVNLSIPQDPEYQGTDWDGGVAAYYSYYYSNSQWYDDSANYPDLTLLIAPYYDPSSQGHVGVVYQGYVIEWITSTGLTWKWTPSYSSTWGHYSLSVSPDVWLFVGEPPIEKPEGKEYPGDLANPAVVARWMARVAYEDYGLPPVLPVMTSYVELTAAWTGPGDVTKISGYLNNVDYDSYGYFQQRPSQGWGSWEQVTNADYALRKFCQVAYDNSGGAWNKDLTDPEQLGQWCQAVQNSNVSDAYRDKGYPAAMKLIEGWDETREEPVPEEKKEIYQKYGWYTFESEDSWNLKYYPPEGKTSPVEPAKEEWHKAVQEIKYRKRDDGRYDITESDGDAFIVDEETFKTHYKPVEEST